MVVNQKWNELAKDDHLWRLHCAMTFNRVSRKNLSNKYSNSYYNYYQRHKKLRFDGCYIMKVLYYIQSEAAMPNFTTSARKAKPYTTIEYYRYLRFFNNSCYFVIHDKTHNIEKIKNDQSFNCIYALSKKKPSEFTLFNCFGTMDISHGNIKRDNGNPVIASYHDKTDGITTHEKVFKGKYNISDKKNCSVVILTDYGLKLEIGLSYYQVIERSSDRLSMSKFDGISLDPNGNEIESTRDHYEVRHEPFIFIPDTRFRFAQEYFD